MHPGRGGDGGWAVEDDDGVANIDGCVGRGIEIWVDIVGMGLYEKVGIEAGAVRTDGWRMGTFDDMGAIGDEDIITKGVVGTPADTLLNRKASYEHNLLSHNSQHLQ
ncbi:hypothetical protein LIER_08865 [Lithospermum erythrorhizon]|uniref:Uncharacterized protein n=1 Tax=Lithospermum erythrorhizon TaxID=34254 RepID=A0AAV3PEV9_LITER